MSISSALDPKEFVATVEPVLARRDADALHALLHARWSCDQIMSLLNGADQDARKVAVLSAGLVGGKECIPVLAEQLKDPCPVVNQITEHAMWSIWFRCGTPPANLELCRGTRALNRRDFSEAEHHFTRALKIDPTFAEAHNQRAIARYLQERYEPAMMDGRHTVRLMPCHFGAWSGMGHCEAHLGDISAALQCYERALAINPHLDRIREAVAAMRNSA